MKQLRRIQFRMLISSESLVSDEVFAATEALSNVVVSTSATDLVSLSTCAICLTCVLVPVCPSILLF